jgi:hypothetical protein
MWKGASVEELAPKNLSKSERALRRDRRCHMTCAKGKRGLSELFQRESKDPRANSSQSCEDPRLGGCATLGEKGGFHQDL